MLGSQILQYIWLNPSAKTIHQLRDDPSKIKRAALKGRQLFTCANLCVSRIFVMMESDNYQIYSSTILELCIIMQSAFKQNSGWFSQRQDRCLRKKKLLFSKNCNDLKWKVEKALLYENRESCKLKNIRMEHFIFIYLNLFVVLSNCAV